MDADDLRKAWGRSLQRIRTEKNISRSILAAATDVDPSTIARIEAGDRFPSEALKIALASALGCSLSELFPYPLLEKGSAA